MMFSVHCPSLMPVDVDQLRSQMLLRKTLGPFFSQMLHFAFTGKKLAPGSGKALTSLSKVKAPALAELLESLIKSLLATLWHCCFE